MIDKITGTAARAPIASGIILSFMIIRAINSLPLIADMIGF